MYLKKWLLIIFIGLFILPLTLEAGQVGDEMPSFSLTTIDGAVVDSDSIIGEKPVFLVFWATWCPNCKRELPHINELAAKFTSQGMFFLGINVGVNDSKAKIRRYAEKLKIDYPIYFDKGSQLTKKFEVSGTPTVIIVDKSGIIRYRDVAPPADLSTHFDKLNK